MTVDPTALQTARLHIGQIRVCWPMLDDARTARISRPSVALSGRAAASRDEDLRAERADRDAAIAYRALAAAPAPVNLAVVDAEAEVRTLISELSWLIRSDLRDWSRLIEPPPDDIDGRLTWLTGMLDNAAPTVVLAAGLALPPAARGLTRAVGYEVEWQPTGRRCPACGQRAIHTWRESSDPRERTLECSGQRDDGKPCRCDGDECPCGRAGARAGSKHLWPA